MHPPAKVIDRPSLRDERIVEIKAQLILKQGPAALTDGEDAIVAAVTQASIDPAE